MHSPLTKNFFVIKALPLSNYTLLLPILCKRPKNNLGLPTRLYLRAFRVIRSYFNFQIKALRTPLHQHLPKGVFKYARSSKNEELRPLQPMAHLGTRRRRSNLQPSARRSLSSHKNPRESLRAGEGVPYLEIEFVGP